VLADRTKVAITVRITDAGLGSRSASKAPSRGFAAGGTQAHGPAPLADPGPAGGRRA